MKDPNNFETNVHQFSNTTPDDPMNISIRKLVNEAFQTGSAIGSEDWDNDQATVNTVNAALGLTTEQLLALILADRARHDAEVRAKLEAKYKEVKADLDNKDGGHRYWLYYEAGEDFGYGFSAGLSEARAALDEILPKPEETKS